MLSAGILPNILPFAHWEARTCSLAIPDRARLHSSQTNQRCSEARNEDSLVYVAARCLFASLLFINDDMK